MKRYLHIEGPGVLLVNTDVHGNGSDFRRMEAIFREEYARLPSTYWVILGDIVHGPDPQTQDEVPELYGYPDESAWIARRVCELQEEFPERVFFVLGNHDYAHIGGKKTSKFYPDEADALENTMSSESISQMHTLFQNALLAVSTSCGVLLTHGSPNDSLRSLEALDGVALPPDPGDSECHAWLKGLLYSYGQNPKVTERMLSQVSSELMKRGQPPLTVVLHGHDRDEEGVFLEGHNQICPVIFGAPRSHKRYTKLDLSDYYTKASSALEAVKFLYSESEKHG